MPGSGVPLSVPVPSPLLTKDTPPGNATPPRAIEGGGKPVVVTVNDPAWPTVNVVALALVIAGAWFTVSVNDCGGVEPTLLVAVNVSAYVPPVPGSGVPLSVPVPSPLSTNATPPGRATPPIAIEGVGNPVVVTVNVPATPTVNVVALALVIAGAVLMPSVIACDPVQPAASVATKVSGKEPPAVGVPSSTPAAEKFIPAGSIPTTLQVTAPLAPVAVNVTGP